MELPLKTVFAFCAAQDGLLRELFAARGGVGEAELYAMARRHGGADQSPAAVVERLRRFRLIEERPGETLVLELTRAAELFRLDGRLHAALTVTAARLARVRKDGTRLFDDAYGEILPLYNRYQRLDQVERGAVLLLDRLERSGVAALRLGRRLPTAVLTFPNLISDADQRARLIAVLGYAPTPPTPLAAPERRTPPMVLTPDQVWARLSADLPLADLMAWVLACWPEAPIDVTLAVFGELRGDERLQVRPVGARRTYRHRDVMLEAAPLLVEAVAA